MPCQCTCKYCGKRFDRYSGYLINLSDDALETLRPMVNFDKHSVLCSDCIEKLLDVEVIPFKYLKTKGKRPKRYFVSNYLYSLRKQGTISKDVDYIQRHWQSFVDACKAVEKDGLIYLQPEIVYVFNYPRDIRNYIKE